MSISFIEAQRALGEATGSYRLLTTSAAGTTTTIVDTGLQDLFLTDTSVPTSWVRFRNGIEAGQIRRLDGSYTFSSGTLTFTRALANAPGAPVDYELWTINPEDIIKAIKRAVPKLAPAVHRKLVDTNTIVNNILDNSSFQNPETVLSFDGAGDADDLVTVTSTSAITDIWDTNGTVEFKATFYSDGESNQGKAVDKGQWFIDTGDELGGFVRLQFTVLHDTASGVWATADRCWELGSPHVLSIRHNVDDVGNDAEFFVDGARVQVLSIAHPSGTRTSDTSSDLIFGNIAGASRTMDGTLSWIRIWNDWRTDREIRENIDSFLTGHELGLIGLWLFDRGSGSSVFDLSVSQNNGAITSATWTVLAPFWSQVNAPTVTVDRDRTFHGSHSLKVVAGGSAGQFTQIPQINIAERAGKTVTAKHWVWTNAGTRARLRLDWDGGSTFENGAYHAGNSEWELLEVSGQIPDSATVVKLILETAASATANWAYGYLDVGRTARYSVPMDFETLNFVSQQILDNDPDGVYLPFTDQQSPHSGRLLKLEGKGSVGVPGASEDILDISGKQVEYLTELSKAELYQTLQGRVEGTVQEKFIAERNDARVSADILSTDRAVKTPFMSAELSKAWKIERNGEETTLVFVNV